MEGQCWTGAPEDQPNLISRHESSAALIAYLIVDQAPLLEESMHAHDGANVSSQIPSAGCDSEVLGRIQSIRIDHEIAVISVYSGRLAAVAIVEELWQGLALAIIDVSHVKPGCITRYNGRIGLCNEV
jgi:hypothetical protein